MKSSQSKIIPLKGKDKIKAEVSQVSFNSIATTERGDVAHNSPQFLPDFKIRCSSLGSIMTDPKSGPGLSETCKTHLIELYVQHKYNRTKKIENKYVEKGRAVEEDAITLYSKLRKSFFRKNKERLTNKYITGEPDLFIGKDILYADCIIDTKCSWDLYTYIKAKYDKTNKDYYWQGMGYMALTGAKQFKLVYCLINTPTSLILDEKRRLAYRLDVIDDYGRPDYIEACKEIERNCIFDDIPDSERMFEIVIDRDEPQIHKIYDRVSASRKWLADTFYTSDSLTETLSKSIELQKQLV